jgi:uridine kinase
MKPHIVGIAGASSSGKTELARRLAEALPGTAIVSLDSYYRSWSHLSLEERQKLNFDRPDALEWELLREHLHAMAEGRAFEEPTYLFAHHTRGPGTRRIEPSEYLIVEGLFVLYRPELRAILKTTVYVETDPEVCYQRRLERDTAERGRTPEFVREQYERTVRPGAEQFVFPTKRYADLVVSGERPFAESVGAVMAALREAKAARTRPPISRDFPWAG